MTDAIDLGTTDEDEPRSTRPIFIDLGSSDEEPRAKRPATARNIAGAGGSDSGIGVSSGSSTSGAATSGRELRVLAWNPGGLCPQASMQPKLSKIMPLLTHDDLIFLPEASISSVDSARRRQLIELNNFADDYNFYYSATGKVALYVKDTVAATAAVCFPQEEALRGSVAIVEDKGGAWAAVGVYAPNMRVKRTGDSTAVDAVGRETFDVALFSLLEALRARVPTVALVGDLNIVWEKSGGGHHGALRERWKAALSRLGFGEPLDQLDANGRVVPTVRHYERTVGRTPPPARIDFLFVASARADAVAGFGRHDRFWQELAWPAEGKPKISEHTPLWLELRV